MALIGAGVSINAELDTNLDSDDYTVHLIGGHVYDFWAGGDFTEGAGFIQDSELELSNGGGTVASDGNSAEENNATFLTDPTTLTTGDYTLRATEFTGAGTGGQYALTFVDKSVEDDVSDHTFGTNAGAATVTGQGTNMVLAEEDVLVGNIERADDTDVIAILVNEALTYNISVRGADTGDGTLANAQVHILDADGNDVTSFGTLDETGSNAVVTNFDPDNGGAGVGLQFVFIQVTSNGGGLGSYEIQFDDTGGGSDFDVSSTASVNSIFNLPLGELTPGDPNHPVSGAIQGTLEDSTDATLGNGDWYAINLVSGFSYEFQIRGGGVGGVAAPEITLRDSSGAAIGGTTIAHTGTVTLDYNVTGASGLYYVDVHGDTPGDTGNYEVSARLTSTPADPVHSITDLQTDVGDPATMRGSDDTDSLTGGAGDDTVDGALANDTLQGGDGDDSLTGGAAVGLVAGGDDSIGGGAGLDTLDGQDGNDTLDGGDNDDSLIGGIGADSILGGLGIDHGNGGDGNDTMDGGDDNDTMLGEGGVDSLLGGFGDDSLDGGNTSEHGNTLDGGAGNDTLNADTAGDLLIGGIGNDSIIGQLGNDTVQAGVGNDTFVGGGGNDNVDGGFGADSLTAAGGNDTLIGGEGDDTIDGGGGTNQENGGNGNDTFNNVDAGDNITAGAGVDTVNSLIGWTLDTDEERLTLLGATNINGNGNAGGNIIFGNNGNNVLQGLAGNDILNGSAGNDTLIGGAGKDLNTGSGGLDHIKYNSISDSGTTFATRDAINTFAHGDKIDLSAIDADISKAGNQAFVFSSSQTLTGVHGQVIAQQVATNAFLVQADDNGDGHADFTLNVYTSPGFGTFHNWDFIL